MKSKKQHTHWLYAKEGNCFLYGCGISAIFLILILASVLFAVRYAGQFRDQYTDLQPIELPVIDLTEEERDALITKVDTYYELLQNGEAVDPLILDQNDLNGIIQFHPEFTTLSDKVYFTLNGDKLSGQVSVPLDAIPMFGDRYFNGTAEFDASFDNGIGKVFVLNATFKGEQVPENILTEVRAENLAADMQRDPETREVLNNVETIEIIEGKIVVTPKTVSTQTDLLTVPETL